MKKFFSVLILSFVLIWGFGVVDGQENIPSCTDSDGGINNYVKGITTGPARCVNQSECMDSVSVTDACDSDNTGIEFYCEDGYRTAAPDFKCPNGCRDGACIKGEKITEIITCIFKNSEKTQECYLAGTTGNNYEGKEFCSGVESCSIEYTSYSGGNATWKSSCGGYQYTKQDGDSETIIFDCQPDNTNGQKISLTSEEPIKTVTSGKRFYTIELISASDDSATIKVANSEGVEESKELVELSSKEINGLSIYLANADENDLELTADIVVKSATIGNFAETINSATEFRFAYWQCYDGKEEKQGEKTSCKPAELWKSYAEEFCKERCSEETGKCGVNSFSVGEKCSETTAVESQSNSDENKIGFTFSKWTCPDGSTHDYGDENGECLSVNFWEGHWIESCSKCDYKEDETCIQKPVSIITSGECVVGDGDDEEKEDKPLVCKDSCPSENSCLPIGYRQKGEYCSGEGAFKTQLGSNEICDNNFECGSNVCISGQCVETGLLQKILDFFRKMFGSKEEA